MSDSLTKQGQSIKHPNLYCDQTQLDEEPATLILTLVPPIFPSTLIVQLAVIALWYSNWDCAFKLLKLKRYAKITDVHKPVNL